MTFSECLAGVSDVSVRRIFQKFTSLSLPHERLYCLLHARCILFKKMLLHTINTLHIYR